MPKQSYDDTIGHMGNVARHEISIQIRVDEEHLRPCCLDNLSQFVKVIEHLPLRHNDAHSTNLKSQVGFGLKQ